MSEPETPSKVGEQLHPAQQLKAGECECPAQAALAEWLRVSALAGDPGYIGDKAGWECGECAPMDGSGKRARTEDVEHELDCYQGGVEQARKALAAPCPCEGLREEWTCPVCQQTCRHDTCGSCVAKQAQSTIDDLRAKLEAAEAKAAAAQADTERLTTLRPASEYHDDLGTVLWWHLPVCEPPYVGAGERMDERRLDGSPTDCARLQRSGWLTHFTVMPNISGLDAARASQVSTARPPDGGRASNIQNPKAHLHG